jgi:hypothetical protein
MDEGSVGGFRDKGRAPFYAIEELSEPRSRHASITEIKRPEGNPGAAAGRRIRYESALFACN